MRAPFDRLVTLYWGPGTATPGVVRIPELPARYVPDLVFRDVEDPLSDSLSYLTCDATMPFGAETTDIGAGIWAFDFTKGDRVGLVPGADPTHYVQRVELRTRPGSDPYWRAYLAPLEAPPVIAPATSCAGITPFPLDTNYNGFIAAGEVQWFRFPNPGFTVRIIFETAGQAVPVNVWIASGAGCSDLMASHDGDHTYFNDGWNFGTSDTSVTRLTGLSSGTAYTLRYEPY